MDLIAAKLGANMAISELAANGQIGSGEPSKTYAWDGDQENKVYVPYMNDGGFVKVSSDTPDLGKFEKLISVNGTLLPSDNSHYFVDGTAENGQLFGAKGHALCEAGTNNPLAVVITDTLNSPIPSTGLYFLCADILNGDIAELTKELVMPSTLKTIDPKYLPSGGGGNSGGGELPVIDLVALGMDLSTIASGGYSEATMTPSSEVQTEIISKLTSSKPVIIKFKVDSAPVEAVFNPLFGGHPGVEEYSASTIGSFMSEPMHYMLKLLATGTLAFLSEPLVVE